MTSPASRLITLIMLLQNRPNQKGAQLAEKRGQLYREAAEGALAKLDNVLPDEQRGEAAWARRSLVATGMHRSDLSLLAPLLDKIRSGARQLRQVRIQYQGSNSGQVTERVVDPYALAHRSGWWYLVGYCHPRQRSRPFR